jgi:hypothetical protein
MIGLPATGSFSVISACCAIAIAVLVFLLAVTDVMSKAESSTKRRTAALRAICVPLVAVFFAFFVVVVRQFA